MDPGRFDDLARALAAGTSRRRFFKQLLTGVGGGLAALTGAASALGQECRLAGRLCNKNANCCSAFCDTENPDPFKRKRCACPGGTVECRGLCRRPEEFLTDPENCGACGNRCPADLCNKAVCAQGVCGLAPDPARVGKSCDDHNLCTLNDVCQADGSCRGTPKDCSAFTDQCNVGACNPANGACFAQPRPNNTPCDDGNACTQTDTCQNGTCVGGNPVVCTALDQCHVPGVCNPATGICSNPNAPNNTPCNDGNACTQTDTCQNGQCVGGNPVVCTALDQCHVPGVCNPSTGVCSNPNAQNNTPCNDGNACTQTDTCQNGVCTGTNLVVCTPLSQCHVAGTCDPSTGQCSNPPASNTTPCENPDLCINGGTCDGQGSCTGGTPNDCSGLTDQCNVGTCNPDNGTCFARPTPDVPCENPDFCLNGGACTAQGTCTGGTPTDCSALTDQCNVGTCNPDTGGCFAQPTPGVSCENPDLCLNGGTCTAQGTCTGGTPVVCTPQSQCHSAACDPSTGGCVQTPLDGTPCENPSLCVNGGTCSAGTCTGGTPVTCTPAGQCFDAVCDPGSGQCVQVPRTGQSCDDGDPCTLSSTCNSQGACIPGTPVDCPPCQICSLGSCVPTAQGQPGPECGNICCNGACCAAQGATCTGTQPPGSCEPPDVCSPVGSSCTTSSDCCNNQNGRLCCSGTCRNTNKNENFCGPTCSPCAQSEICLMGVCSDTGIDLRRVGGGIMEVDDDLTILVNDVVVFSESDGFITTYAPFDLNLENGDRIRIQAFNAQCCRAHIDPFELFRPSDGATQVLDAVGFEANGSGAGLVIGRFYNREFIVNLP